METQLLATKLFVPQARPGLIPRPRLIEQLNSALNSPFTLVSAPAGFGKTTILTQWIKAIGKATPVGWVQLDEGDNDPVRFWDYFIGAVRKQLPDAGQTALSMLHAPRTYSREAILSSLLNDLADARSDGVLVIDDYHAIKAEAIHTGLTFLIDHSPPEFHLIIATRVDPMVPLAHFRGRGAMIEIGADDLRFTSGEADEFLRAQGMELDREDITRLNAKAEGWAVGLKMAATAMRGRKDLSRFVTTFAGNQRYIMDYLIEEVLKNQRDSVRSFLLTTSILQKMTSRLCDAVSGRSDGRESLAQLEQSNLFLVPLDDSRQWFRYHHLFADLLRHELQMESPPDQVRDLHQRATAWYEKQEMVDDAIHHAIEAADWERAVRLIAGVAEDRLKHGAIVTVCEWLRKVPEEAFSSNFDLYRHYCRALAETGHIAEAGEALRKLLDAAQGNANLEGEVAYLKSDAAVRIGKIDESIQAGEQALSLLDPGNAAFRCLANFRVGFNQHHQGSLDRGWVRLTDAFTIAQQTGDRNIAAWSANFLAAIMHQRGEIKSALEMAKRGLEIAGETPAAAGPHCRLCMIPYEMNDLKAAANHARLAVEWNRLTGDSASIVGLIYLALARLASGDLGGANEAMSDCDRAVEDPKITRLFHARHIVGRVMFALRMNDLEAASRWGERLGDFPDCFPFEFAHVPARLLIAQGKRAEAAESLRIVYEKALNVGAQGLAIGIRVCQALAAETEEDALGFLSEALVKAEPEGYVRTFVDEGKLLAPLLRKAESRGIVPAYTARLLRTIHDEEQRHGVVMLNSRGFPLSGPLSERELEILRLLETGLSNRQIADRLVITLSTAKTHIHNISRKLEANTRTQAIARARELKLI